MALRIVEPEDTLAEIPKPTATVHRLRRDLKDSLLLSDDEIELYGLIARQASDLKIAADAIRHGQPRHRRAAARWARRIAESVIEATDKYLALEDGNGKA